MSGELFKVLVSLLFAAFFSGVETAFISSNKLHIAVQKQKGGVIGSILDKFANRSSRFLTAILICNTIALVVYGMAIATIIAQPIEQFLLSIFPASTEMAYSSLNLMSIFAQTIVATLIVISTAEFLPKSISLSNPYGFLRVMAIPINIIYTIMLPATWIIDKMAEQVITKGFRMKYQPNRPVLFGLADLISYIQQTKKSSFGSEPGAQKVEEEIFNNVLDLKTTRVRDCMTPRTEIAAISREITIAGLREAFVSSGHTKLLVYNGSIDNIIGYCHMMEMMKKPQRLEDVMADIIAVPETFSANDLMVQFINERKSIAVIVDEFGGTSGIVTMEDLIEVVFGSIEDEYDTPEWAFEQLDAHTYQLSARHEIEYLNMEHGWDIPEGDYDTLGGYILHLNESFPKKGDKIKDDRFVIEVISLQEARINLVKITFDQ